MWKKTLFNVAKVVILAFLSFTIKPLEATRPLDDMNTSISAKKMSFEGIEHWYHLLALILAHTSPDLVLVIAINEQALALVFVETEATADHNVGF
ncbi:hypothetical protein CMV_020579 [Castanea mollissima]|uniref:Uncharacterized protein n=1 Tax=Castanea mollissima TaxID=60419 RepID=A0A8J4VDH2_9ROSI|nr:hypothetical protein CMV_020579 [Castanea mollissima]